MSFGAYGGFPFRFGGAKSAKKAELQAIVDALSPAFGTSTETASYAEAVAEASALAMIWSCNKRLTNQAQPMRMLEVLPVWEEALGLRPAAGDTAVARRRQVAGKLKALGDNSAVGVRAALDAVLGQNLDDVLYVATADEITYWPGVNPGPPGFEWSSNRARVAVRMNESALGDLEFEAKRNAAAVILDALLPAYVRFAIGVGSGFVCDQGIIGKTFFA